MSVNNSNVTNLPIIQKCKLAMLPDKPLYQYSYSYLENEFNNARLHETGILRSEDPEFLHQYRVCLRRTRAIVSLLKDIFPANEKKYLSIRLKKLMQKTNLLRDLDVYLLKKEMFFKQLDHKYHNGLAVFFDDIQARRATELESFCDWLHSGFYRQQCLEIALHLQTIKGTVLPKPANIPCGTYGRKAVWKQFQKVSDRIRNINAQSADTAIHRLRVDCKKLRYLLEYFESLFNKIDYQRELKTLKKLQNYLGDFNDSSVQHVFLSHYLAHQNETSSRYKAVRKLLHTSRNEHYQAKTNILQQLKHFSQTKVNYQTLCQLIT